MKKHYKKIYTALTFVFLLSISTGFAKAPDFLLQIPYTGNGCPASPQEDYYLYMNAGWLKNTPIPENKGEASCFNDADTKVSTQMTALTNQAVKHQAAGTATMDEKNIAKLYACVRDQKGRDKAGLGNLASITQRIDAVKNLQEYAETMADICSHNEHINAMIGDYSIINDPIENTHYIVALNLPASLPKEQADDPYIDFRAVSYQKHIASLFQLYGWNANKATKAARDIYMLQKDLGHYSYTISEQQNPSKIFNKLNLNDLKKLYSHVNVPAMLNTAGIGPNAGVTNWYISNPGLIAHFNELYTPELLPTLKECAIYTLLDTHSALLTSDYRRIASSNAQESIGAKNEDSPESWDLQTTQALLPFTYGRLYAASYFDEAKKNEVKSYVQLIMDNYKNKLQKLEWLTPATKQTAIKKLDAMDINIGYPEAWQEYIDHLDIHSPQEGGCLINNVLTLFNQTAQWNRARIGTPVRKDLWEDMTPQTINAAYLLTDNSINFPAGILQPPFYDSKATRYTNLGGVGTIIAHEITHSFDNDGAQFDELGRHRNWWQPSDYEEFKKRQEKIVEYYDRYLLPDGTRLNGTQTLSENIADLGGLTCITDIIGHNSEGLRQAYQNFGTIWRDKSSNSLLKAMLENIHALPYARVDGVLSSTDGFYYAYSLKPSDSMYVAPENRAKLW